MSCSRARKRTTLSGLELVLNGGIWCQLQLSDFELTVSGEASAACTLAVYDSSTAARQFWQEEASGTQQVRTRGIGLADRDADDVLGREHGGARFVVDTQRRPDAKAASASLQCLKRAEPKPHRAVRVPAGSAEVSPPRSIPSRPLAIQVTVDPSPAPSVCAAQCQLHA